MLAWGARECIVATYLKCLQNTKTCLCVCVCVCASLSLRHYYTLVCWLLECIYYRVQPHTQTLRLVRVLTIHQQKHQFRHVHWGRNWINTKFRRGQIFSFCLFWTSFEHPIDRNLSAQGSKVNFNDLSETFRVTFQTFFHYFTGSVNYELFGYWWTYVSGALACFSTSQRLHSSCCVFVHAQFTCDHVDVRIRVFAQRHSQAVSLERLS